jgi:isoleucyl-tRNA synthetase
MAPRTEADEIRTLAAIMKAGFVYRGLKPVNWCFDCGSALPRRKWNTPTRRTSRSTSASLSVIRSDWLPPSDWTACRMNTATP